MNVPGAGSQPWPVKVVGVAGEDDQRLTTDPRGGLTASSGEISLLILRTVLGVTLGNAITRRPELVAGIRKIPGIGVVRTSSMGGTVGPGGENWLSFLAVGRLPDPCPLPLDRLINALRVFLNERLASLGINLVQGRVDGAWCPGFSDLSVDGRKLVGLGLRLTAGWGLVRGVVAVSPPDADELAHLDACHRLFGPGIDRNRMTSLAEISGLERMDRELAIRLLGAPAQLPAKISK